MKRNGIAVIGRVAKDVELIDGQTVKTRVLYEELCNRFPGHSVITVDTYRYGKRFPVILVNLIRAFLHSKHIFVLLSRNGRTYLFPVITGLNRLFRRHLYHDVIGGALPKEAAASPSLRKQLGRFEVNWVETVQMKEALQEVGVTNVEILHNFKRLPILIPNQLSLEREEPYIFTMFSRVVREKGMDHASKAVAEVNRRAGRTRALLRIYGPIDPSYEVEFIALLKQYEGVVTYEGCVPYKESVEALSRSFVLLFPSTYPGEGMPGTILDAFAAGVPVIATDWHFNGELVHNGITGYCYDWHNMEQLTEWVAYAVEHPEEIDQMRENCLQAAHLYSADAAMEQICRRMGEDGELQYMNENFPLVTVIITTYQNVEYLPRAIKSVLGQTYSPIELIVVDDNSPESQARTDTEEVMRRYPDVIYLRHERNKNGAAARNTGIRAAKGEYIGFLDNDDFYFAHHISSCVQALEQNPEDACVLTGVVKIRGGLCWEINRPPEGLAMDTALLRSERALGTGSNLFLRTEVVREHKGFDEKFLRHQDVEFALRIFSKNSVSRIQEVQIVKEMDGFSNVPNFERFRSTKQQFLNKFEQLIASLPEEEKRRFYAASYGALLYTACQEGDSTHINWVMTQLRQRHALTKRNLFLFFISSVGIFSFYEKCKGQIKKRRSQRLYSDVLKELTEEDRRLLGEALGVEEESRG